MSLNLTLAVTHMKRILINATQKEELRVAMVNGQKLYDLDIEVPSREQKKSNIYKAKITRVEPSLEAVFVNYGADRHGFLPFKEIAREYIDETAKDEKGKLNIKAAIKVDQEIIVQVEKEERGNKGAALTTFISLAGRFLVAMPHNPKAGGVSRRIEGEDRDQVRKVLSELNMPKGMGIIVRTAGVGRSTEEMQWDLDSLAQVWGSIERASKDRPAPFLIYQESDIVVRALRDHYKSDVGEIIIDSKSFYDRAHAFMEMVMPNALHKLKLFDEKLPLFNRFQIESQIETAFSREVNLPSGGAIVIDHTEALISIDVNSARATKGSDIEATAKNTNLEAADEIARQLRIRDLGGLVVIDFIDMLKNSNQREVEQRLRNAVYEDRARVQTTRISRFGLMEMSRQRLRPSLGESSQIVCPRCTGQGTIRDTESLSLAVLRLLEEEALKDNTGRILVKIPVDCATYILNEKRENIAALENRHKVHAVIIPDPNLETPHFEIERVRGTDTQKHESTYKHSYELTTEDNKPTYSPLDEKKSDTPEQPVVQRISHGQPKPPAPVQEKTNEEGGFISRILATLFGTDNKKESEKTPKSEQHKNRGRRQQRGGRRNNQNRNNTNKNQRNRNNQNRNQKNTDHNKNSEHATAQTNDKKNQDSNKPQHQTHNKQQNAESKPKNNRNRNRNRNRKPNPKHNEHSHTAEKQHTKTTEQSGTPIKNKNEQSTSPENTGQQIKHVENNPTKKVPAQNNSTKSTIKQEHNNEQKIDSDTKAATQDTKPKVPTAKKDETKPESKIQTAAKANNTANKSEKSEVKAETENNKKPKPRAKPKAQTTTKTEATKATAKDKTPEKTRKKAIKKPKTESENPTEARQKAPVTEKKETGITKTDTPEKKPVPTIKKPDSTEKAKE